MKITFGNSSATSCTKSHEPLATTSSSTSAKRARTIDSMLATAPGAKNGPSSCRHAVCSRPSSISGIQRYIGSGSAGTTARFENVSAAWNEARMSAMRVTRKYCAGPAMPVWMAPSSRFASKLSKCHPAGAASMFTSWKWVTGHCPGLRSSVTSVIAVNPRVAGTCRWIVSPGPHARRTHEILTSFPFRFESDAWVTTTVVGGDSNTGGVCACSSRTWC